MAFNYRNFSFEIIFDLNDGTFGGVATSTSHPDAWLAFEDYNARDAHFEAIAIIDEYLDG